MNLSDFRRDYLFLSLRINKAIEDEVDRKYIEVYFDPDELQRLVINEKSISPIKLLDTCQKLQEDLNNQGFEKKRVNFLERMLLSMETMLKIRKGEDMPYLKRIRGLYDIEPQLIDDSEIHEITKKLDSIHEGSGTLLSRLTKIRGKKDDSSLQDHALI
ncbi:MAG: hypothetical protein ACFFG0_06980 [Candidatus Thorarchaeota archaeon]